MELYKYRKWINNNIDEFKKKLVYEIKNKILCLRKALIGHVDFISIRRLLLDAEKAHKRNL